jgi:hypothetical protein
MMPKNTEAFSENDRVSHAVYGLGTIRQLNERRTTIAFDGGRTRIFVTSMVQLQHSTTPARAKPARGAKATSAKSAK